MTAKLINTDDIHIVWNGGRRNGKTVFADTFEKFFNEIIEKAPTVDAEPVRHGHWIMTKGINGNDYRKCSNCLHTQPITGLMNYCPICGAKMYEERKEE